MSSQESVGESRVSHPTPGPGANSDAYHFGPSTEDEMEVDLKRIDAMEEDQEVTSRPKQNSLWGNYLAWLSLLRSLLSTPDFFLMKI